MMNNLILTLLFYWFVSYLYLLIWSIRLRRKHKMTDLNKVGEALVYAVTCFIGLFIILVVKPMDLKNAKLP